MSFVSLTLWLADPFTHCRFTFLAHVERIKLHLTVFRENDKRWMIMWSIFWCHYFFRTFFFIKKTRNLEYLCSPHHFTFGSFQCFSLSLFFIGLNFFSMTIKKLVSWVLRSQHHVILAYLRSPALSTEINMLGCGLLLPFPPSHTLQPVYLYSASLCFTLRFTSSAWSEKKTAAKFRVSFCRCVRLPIH